MNARTLVVSLACLALTPAANAVSLSQNGAGQALLYPYYTVQGENNTLFSIANPWYGRLGQFKAVKVRFREHRNGRPVADFNLYLAPGMVFTGMVTRNPEGRPILVTQSPACTVPRFAPSTAMRLRFSARHTSFHSARTRCSPRMLNCRNPSTFLIQPFGGSAIHLRLR